MAFLAAKEIIIYCARLENTEARRLANAWEAEVKPKPRSRGLRWRVRLFWPDALLIAAATA